MNAIPAELDGAFDFCWSSCALEHLGSIEQGLAFIERSSRCLRPGGGYVDVPPYPTPAEVGTTLSVLHLRLLIAAHRSTSVGIIVRTNPDGPGIKSRLECRRVGAAALAGLVRCWLQAKRNLLHRQSDRVVLGARELYEKLDAVCASPWAPRFVALLNREQMYQDAPRVPGVKSLSSAVAPAR